MEKNPSSLSNLPTMAEAGLPDFEITSWFGLLAPSTPEQFAAHIKSEIARFTRIAKAAGIKAE